MPKNKPNQCQCGFCIWARASSINARQLVKVKVWRKLRATLLGYIEEGYQGEASDAYMKVFHECTAMFTGRAQTHRRRESQRVALLLAMLPRYPEGG